MGHVFASLLDSVAGTVGSEAVKPHFIIEDDSSAVPNSGAVDANSTALSEPSHRPHVRTAQSFQAPAPSTPVETTASHGHGDDAVNLDHIPTPAEFYGVAHPLVVFITPNYRNEPPSNAMLGELGLMQVIASMRNPDGSQGIEIARWIPNDLNDLEGRLISVDPLAGTRNNHELIDGTSQRELNIRLDIDRVVAVIVRFPISEAQFAQIHTVFCTYGRPRLIADFSNAGLYVDMKFGPSRQEREKFGTNATTRPYPVKVLSQFDAVRVPTARLAEQIERDMKGAI